MFSPPRRMQAQDSSSGQTLVPGDGSHSGGGISDSFLSSNKLVYIATWCRARIRDRYTQIFVQGESSVSL